jgi:hypothetical protein
MYYEQLRVWTRDHLVHHLKPILEAEEDLNGDSVALVMPKYIDLASVLGGVVAVARNTLPQYAIDCNSKITDFSAENLNTYAYSGSISLIVGATDAAAADKLASRHSAAVEKYVMTHRFGHQTQHPHGFWIIGFAWVNTDFSGAIKLEDENQTQEFWVSAADVQVQWQTSEDSAMEHE